MTFSKALKELQKNGRLVRRDNWEPQDYIGIWDVKHGSAMGHSYIFTMHEGSAYPWTPSQVDLFATDWEFFDE